MIMNNCDDDDDNDDDDCDDDDCDDDDCDEDNNEMIEPDEEYVSGPVPPCHGLPGGVSLAKITFLHHSSQTPATPPRSQSLITSFNQF